MSGLLAFLQVVLVIGGMIGAMLAFICLMGFIEDTMERRDKAERLRISQSRCPVCQGTGSVLIDEESYGVGYWPANDWCHEHQVKMKRIREMERELMEGDESA